MNQEQQVELVRLFLEEEVQAAIKDLNAEGAPGLDGLPMFFYSEFIELVGPKVMAMFKEFLQEIYSMEKINKSQLSLLLE